MNIRRQHRNLIFLLCLLSGVISIIFLRVTSFDTFLLPHQTSILPNQHVLSYDHAEPHTPPDYLVCLIDDDPDGVNNFGIYHPTDLAVTVSNLQRLGIKHLFLGTHLHWPDLDKEENSALNSTIQKLDSCIISVPLRRTTASTPPPHYLDHSSLPTATVRGNTSLIPLVNNVSFAPTFPIPENTQVGFSQLENEPSTNDIPILARWGNKIILSSLLLERLHHLKISPSQIEIHLGDHILLGSTGNIIPIDDHGYYSPKSFPAEIQPHIIASHITLNKTSPIETTSSIITAKGDIADHYRAIDRPVLQLTQLTVTPILKDSITYQPFPLFLLLLCVATLAYFLASRYNTSPKSLVITFLIATLATILLAIIIPKITSYFVSLTAFNLVILTSLISYFTLQQREKNYLESNAGFIDPESTSQIFQREKKTYTQARTESKTRGKQRKTAKKKNRKAKRKAKTQPAKQTKKQPQKEAKKQSP